MHGGSRLRTPHPLRVRAGALLGAVLILTGCSSQVEVAVPVGSNAPACASASWPETVAGEASVPTSPRSPAVHAWGEPAIIARCGLSALAPTTDPCVEVDGVGWVARELSDGTAMTTFGTDPALEILVPDTYGPAPLLLPAFSDLAKALPRTTLECR